MDSRIINLELKLQQKEVEAAELRKEAAERAETVSNYAKRVATAKNMYNELYLVKNELAKTYNSLVTSFHRLNDAQTRIKSAEAIPDDDDDVPLNMLDELQKLQVELAEMPTVDELQRFAKEGREIDDVKKKIQATNQWLQENDSAEVLQRKIRDQKEAISNERTNSTVNNSKRTSYRAVTLTSRDEKTEEFLNRFFMDSDSSNANKMEVTSTQKDSKLRKKNKFQYDDSSSNDE